ncbi:serine/threonine-protein kinase [Streptomyces sp. NPDC023588]|uniref:serine/threonine-protein kinase n=1 Tax=Streptomyces sp. NPDC023588 TaxID=3154907 RepID=UPI0033D2C65B
MTAHEDPNSGARAEPEGSDSGPARDSGEQESRERLLAGRYLLVEILGHGGMGTVWRAKDQLLDREVAVKELIISGLTDQERSTLHSRMTQEARAAARIKHPNVIAVYDVLEQEGRPWIVMELVDGRSLADTIATEGTLLPHEAARVGVQVVAALEQSHRHGVLHRDVKPANVLLERGGRVVLTDFGIALFEGGSGLTRTGDIVGSPDFVSPEQASGHRPGPASDLWSLGATLYVAVEGRAPFSRTSTLSTLHAVVAEPLLEPRNAGPLKPAIEALLRKDPDERPTADQTLRMLEAVTAGQLLTIGMPHTPTQTVASGRPGGPETEVANGVRKGEGKRSRRARLLVAGAGLALILIAGGITFAMLNIRGQSSTHTDILPSRTAAATGPSTVSANPCPGQGTANLPVGWTELKGTAISPGADPGGFCIRFGGLYWGGIYFSQVPGPNYTVTVDGKLASGAGGMASGSGWGLAARTTIAANGTVTGHGIQYDPNGYRDVDYPKDSGTTYPAATDNEWHQLAISVHGSQYTLSADGQTVTQGTLLQPAEDHGGAFVRVWFGATVELRNLRIIPQD